MKTIADAILKLNPDAKFKIDMPNVLSDAADAEITWLEGTPEISKTDIQNKLDELRSSEVDVKASAKNKLMNGEALTEDEANVMVGL